MPVFVSHSEAVHVETRDPITPERARELFAAVPGVVVQDDPADHVYPLATEAAGRDEIFVGRVRQDPSIADGRGHRVLGRVSDNLRKGAATNAVEIAEVLVERDWIRRPPRAGRAVPGAVRRPRRDRRRAPRGARGDRRRGPRLHPLPAPRGRGRNAVPGEGNPDTEVVFVGEGPGFNEDRQGRPFVGRAGDLLVKLLGSIGWRREEVFITNVVKCRPPDNRDPQPDEIAACAPYLQRQLEVLDPAARRDARPLLDGHVHARARGSARPTARPRRSTRRPARRDALVFAMYHPAAALRTPAIERDELRGHGRRPGALLEARAPRRRAEAAATAAAAAPARRRRRRRARRGRRVAADRPTARRRRPSPPTAADALLTSARPRTHPTTTSRSGSSRSAGWARSARTCTSSSTATTSSSSTAA